MTIADIKKLASVDGAVLHKLFADKQAAFAAAHELCFQQVIDVTSRAYFSAAGWPERSWEAGRALAELLDANPLVATVGFVKAYAAGAETAQRVEDSYAAFMFLLQDGLVHSKREPPPSREAMEAIIASVFEIVSLQAREPKPQASRMLGYIAHTWLTPFLGVTASDRFIDGQLRAPSRGNTSAASRATLLAGPRGSGQRGRGWRGGSLAGARGRPAIAPSPPACPLGTARGPASCQLSDLARLTVINAQGCTRVRA